MSGIDPQGCQVYSFKAPSSEELDHDFLWRTSRRCRSAAGSASSTAPTTKRRSSCACIRSFSQAEAAAELVTNRIWKERFEDINAFERYLARNGFVIRKFFLNVSRAEQRRRFLERLDQPEKNWKFSIGDLAERDRWRGYMAAYEDTIRADGEPARALGRDPGRRQEVRARRSSRPR